MATGTGMPDHDAQTRDAVNRIPGLAASTCFREAMLNVAAQFRAQGLDWRAASGAQSNQDGFESRMDAVVKGGAVRVNMPSATKRFIKERWPGYRFLTNLGDEMVFTKPIAGRHHLGLIVTRINFFGVGKAFTVGLILYDSEVSENRWPFFETNLFRLFDHGSLMEPVYTYRSKEDLQAALGKVDGFLRLCLPRIESLLVEMLVSDGERLPDSITCQGPITAREGLPIALEAAKQIASGELQLTGVQPSTDLLFRKEYGPGLAFDGKILPHGKWVYFFFDPTHPLHLMMVDVPYAGSPSVLTYEREGPGEETDFFMPDRFWQTPLPADWLDSDQAVERSEAAGGAEARAGEGTETFEFIPHLSTEKDGQCWRIHYLIVRNSQRADYKVVLDAVSGNILHIGMV